VNKCTQFQKCVMVKHVGVVKMLERVHAGEEEVYGYADDADDDSLEDEEGMEDGSID